MVATGEGTVLEVQHMPAVLPLGYVVQHKVAAVQRTLNAGRVAFVGDPAAAGQRLVTDLAGARLPFIVALRHAGEASEVLARRSQVECHEIRPLPEAAGVARGVRRIRCLMPWAADSAARHRTMMIDLVRALSQREGLGVPMLARFGERVGEAEEWEGVTLLTTNLDWTPNELYRTFAACAGFGEIEDDFSDLFAALLSTDLGCDSICSVLSGWQILMPAVLAIRSTMFVALKGADDDLDWEKVRTALTEKTLLVPGCRNAAMPAVRLATAPLVETMITKLAAAWGIAGHLDNGVREGAAT
jgi:hypothetical protein